MSKAMKLDGLDPSLADQSFEFLCKATPPPTTPNTRARARGPTHTYGVPSRNRVKTEGTQSLLSFQPRLRASQSRNLVIHKRRPERLWRYLQRTRSVAGLGRSLLGRHAARALLTTRRLEPHREQRCSTAFGFRPCPLFTGKVGIC